MPVCLRISLVSLTHTCRCLAVDEETSKRMRRVLFFGMIMEKLELLRHGKPMGASLLCEEERHFMWRVGFFLSWKYPEAAFKAYRAIRSFITYHGIFMGPGYDLGDESIWKATRPCSLPCGKILLVTQTNQSK